MNKMNLMKSVGMLFSAGLFVAYGANEVDAAEATYQVQTGDSLSKIAYDNGMSLQELLNENTDITNPDLIFVGDKIKLSSDKKVEEQPSNNETQQVEKEAAPQQVETQTSVQSNGYAHPLNMPGALVSSEFGYRQDPTGYSGTQHDGIDLAVATGTPVYSVKSGTVVDAGFHWSAGNYVIVQHADGMYTYYFHLNSINAYTGQQVAQLENIGTVGTTGNSTGPHLHFGVSTRLWSGYVNPRNYVAF